MRSSVRVLIALVALGFSLRLVLAQTHQQPSTSELMRILRITTMRVRMPEDPSDVWSLTVVKHTQVRPQGRNPTALTTRTGLFSMRDKGGDVYEFTLPERSGAFSQGDFNLCKETTCGGQYSVKWLKHPVYSADGTQCLLAQFSNLNDQDGSSYIALVVARSRP
jgi:hypothetical protein